MSAIPQTLRHVLVINSGSSSLKVSLFSGNLAQNTPLRFDAEIKNLHLSNSELILSFPNETKKLQLKQPYPLEEGLLLIFSHLQNMDREALSHLSGIGHRYVHGGMSYTQTTQINTKIIHELEELNDLAPLHNPSCFLGIKVCKKYFGEKVPQFAVFDTAFHHTMPPTATTYAIPAELNQKYPIKRYGFHGISVEFAFHLYQESQAPSINQSRVIVAHLGNGCSLTALKDGKSMDTSMGFTPAEGLIMATRAGDIDAGLFEFLCSHEDKTAKEILEQLTSSSGLLGVSKMSSDMKVLIEKSSVDATAAFAIDLFCYRIVKYIGAYLSVLQGLDALIFTGGIGERAPLIREKIIEKMGWYGMKLNQKCNNELKSLNAGSIKKISEATSQGIYVVGSDENALIAKKVLKSLGKDGTTKFNDE